jgi:hypothetical protein
MRRCHILIPAALVLAVTVAGCGLSNPYASRTSTTESPKAPTGARIRVRNADPAPERGGTIPNTAAKAQTLSRAAGAPTPRAALERYALIYINWTASTVAAAQRRLAEISVGGARAQALQAAANYQHDTTLLRSHVANRGTVVAITAGQSSTRGSWVVVTREVTSGEGDYAGLPAQLHITYGQVIHTPAGWNVNSWRPQT